jgi:hypothetical protein
MHLDKFGDTQLSECFGGIEKYENRLCWNERRPVAFGAY